MKWKDALRKSLRRAGLLEPLTIRAHGFQRLRPHLHLAAPRHGDDSRQLVSQVCRHATLDSPTFRSWLDRLGEPWRAHRKLWELAFIAQALHERGLLAPGRRGLGFAVGAEKLPALFAALGCSIVATDLPADDDRRRPWARTGQWVDSLEALNAAGLCDPDAFRQRVVHRPVDMNHIPDDLRGFDFAWSTCSFEHCGSIELGLRFLEAQMACLRPGGVAVHTTEFNLSSNRGTRRRGACVVFRLCDLEAVCGRLTDAGHAVEPFDLDPGSHPLDRHVDEPPFRDADAGTGGTQVKHLRLALYGYASTSIALIIRKAGG